MEHTSSEVVGKAVKAFNILFNQKITDKMAVTLIDLISTAATGERAENSKPASKRMSRPGYQSVAKKLYPSALAGVKKSGRATTGFLREKFHIGYQTASALLDRMEAEGVISGRDPRGVRMVLPASKKEA